MTKNKPTYWVVIDADTPTLRRLIPWCGNVNMEGPRRCYACRVARRTWHVDIWTLEEHRARRFTLNTAVGAVAATSGAKCVTAKPIESMQCPHGTPLVQWCQACDDDELPF